MPRDKSKEKERLARLVKTELGSRLYLRPIYVENPELVDFLAGAIQKLEAEKDQTIERLKKLRKDTDDVEAWDLALAQFAGFEGSFVKSLLACGKKKFSDATSYCVRSLGDVHKSMIEELLRAAAGKG